MRNIAVITEPCVGVCDTACVEVCPVDCIHGPVPLSDIQAVPVEGRSEKFPGIQMFVDPEECIGCWACVPACPVSAIFEDAEVPEEWTPYIARNAEFFENRKP